MLKPPYDKVMVHIRGLSLLSIKTAQYGSTLIPVLMSKMPNGICLRIAREIFSESCKITLIGTILKEGQGTRRPVKVLEF